MQVGAVGFSNPTSSQHNGEAGIPMPSRLAGDAEFDTLAATLAESGKGTIDDHQGQRDVGACSKRCRHARAGRSWWRHCCTAMPARSGVRDLALIAEARGARHRLYGAVSPCPLTFEFNFHAPYVFEGLAAWLPAMEAHDESRFASCWRARPFATR